MRDKTVNRKGIDSMWRLVNRVLMALDHWLTSHPPKTDQSERLRSSVSPAVKSWQYDVYIRSNVGPSSRSR